MRHGRAKTARRTLKFFALNGDIHPPYQVLLDGNFLVTAMRQKIAIKERIRKLLQKEKHELYVTQSVMDELKALPGDEFDAARQFGFEECLILDPDSTPSSKDGEKKSSVTTVADDIIQLVSDGNINKYMVCTQDENLSLTLRRIPNVPMMHITQSLLLLEPVSSASKRTAQRLEKGKLLNDMINDDERGIVERLRSKEKSAKKDDERRKRSALAIELGKGHGGRLKRKAKEPNSLSCKKAKKGQKKSK